MQYWVSVVLLVNLVGCAGENEGDSTGSQTEGAGIENSSQNEIPENPGGWYDNCPLDEIEERQLNVGEVTLNVGCRGSGPTVVFLHGFPEFHYSWNKVMDELASEFRLVAPDQRGYNLSEKPESLQSYVLPKLAEDILNLLPLVSTKPVILVAHDWGGPVGWLVAHHEDAHLRGFVAANGPHPIRFSYLLENDAAQQSASGYMAWFRDPNAESYIDADSFASTMADVLTDEELVRYRAAWEQPGAITGGLNWYRANELSHEGSLELMADLLPKVTVPTTVMWGLDDNAVLASNAEELEQFVVDLQVETFAGVDHWIEHRIPDEIARVIRAVDVRAAVPVD